MDGRDNMAQDQEMSNPIIQPVVEEFDVSQISSEINAVDAELSDAPFVFHLDPVSGRGRVLHHRTDGHYGLLLPADVTA